MPFDKARHQKPAGAGRGVKANKGSTGADGRTIAETADYLKTEWLRIRRDREAWRGGGDLMSSRRTGL